MDIDLLKARHSDFKYTKKNNSRAIIPLNIILSLHLLLANPKLGIALSALSLIILLIYTGITQSTSSPKPLQCKEEADRIPLEIFISFLDAGGIVGVVLMLPSSAPVNLQPNYYGVH